MMNVLLVDDEELMVRALQRHLRGEDVCQIHTARTVAEAQHVLATEQIDLMLVDMNLGSGSFDGRRLLQWAEAHSPHTSRVLMSGTPYGRDAAPEAQLILCKPFPMRALRQCVAQVVAKQPLSQLTLDMSL